MLKVGDKLIAKWTEEFTDKVTEGSVYEVCRVEDIGFYIINDEGVERFPISTEFKRMEAK